VQVSVGVQKLFSKEERIHRAHFAQVSRVLGISAQVTGLRSDWFKLAQEARDLSKKDVRPRSPQSLIECK
jgi:hypothetical protein